MRVDELVFTREQIDKYEKVKKKYFITVLVNIRRLKALQDEEGVKGELEVFIKMMPRYKAVIEEEIKKFGSIPEIVSKLKIQIGLLEQLDYYSHKYSQDKENVHVNDYYNNIFQLLNNFIKYCSIIESIRIKSVSKEAA